MKDALTRQVLRGYRAAAPDLIAPYEALDCETVLAPVLSDIAQAGGDILDLGAGTGRDAAWLARRGHRVWAVEPVAPFRIAGQRAHGAAIRWVEDRLPELRAVRALARQFDMILSNGVWHHLSEDHQLQAMDSCAALLAPGGRMILSLRHGPTPQDRPGASVDTAGLITHAAGLGLRLHSSVLGRASVQAGNRKAGVTWDWLVFVRE